MENFFRKYDPSRSAARVHAMRLKLPFDQLCMRLKKKFSMDPREFWAMDQHGHAARPCDIKHSASRAARQRKQRRSARSTGDTGGTGTVGGGMSRVLLVEQRLEEAKRSMRYAFYKPSKPTPISREQIDAELRRNGFKLGLVNATAEQVLVTPLLSPLQY